MNYMKLDVWQQAIDLAVRVYLITMPFPRDERYGLTTQMRRAAISVSSNIAEGEGRRTWRDRAHYYVQARGSLHEVETQLIIAERLHFCESAALLNNARKVGQLINGVLRNLQRQSKSRVAGSG